MKVLMKRFEKLALDFTKKYKSWDLQCVSKDSYLTGYKQAILDVKALVDSKYYDYDWSPTSEDFNNVGQEEVEVEFKDGLHQLVDDSITKIIKPSKPLADFSWIPMNRYISPDDIKFIKSVQSVPLSKEEQKSLEESTTLSDDFLKEV